MKGSSLIFLKLGGSLLGDKRKERSFRAGVVERIGREIVGVLKEHKDLRILLAHGGGAAHHPAARYRVREGLPGGGGWRGFARTRRSVMATNRRVLEALARGGLDVVLVSPVGGMIARDGKIVRWDTGVIEAALAAGQAPLIHGDVVLDRTLGFTIAGTEEIFAFLAPRLRPQRVVLACDVQGVYFDGSAEPAGVETERAGRGMRVLRMVNHANIGVVRRMMRRGAAFCGEPSRRDVTGGMPAKVEHLYAMVRRDRGLEACIVSGLKEGVVAAALRGERAGTTVRWHC